MTEERRTRVLLVGENPETFNGNGNMMGVCLEDIDSDQYEVCTFLKNEVPVPLYEDPFNQQPTFNAPVVRAEDGSDPWGKRRLLILLQSTPIDMVVFVGIDIWRYSDIFDHIKEIQNKVGFTWKALVPYDLDHVRDDWINWLNYPDQVYIYSRYGYDMVKDRVPQANYFRPRLRFSDMYQVPSDEQKKLIRSHVFPDVTDDTEILCFVGNNQVRKNIYGTLEAFSKVLKKRNDVLLYMHLDDPTQIFGIERIKKDLGIPDDKVRHNNHSRRLWPDEMMSLMQSMDCHLLPSLQEGLSWTVVETKLIGMPSILSHSTAHIDFSSETHKTHLPKPIIPIKPDQRQLMPLVSDQGPCYFNITSCSGDAISKAILQYMGNVKSKKNSDYKEKIQKNARVMGVNWTNDCHNFQTDLLEDEYQPVTQGNNLGEVI